MAKRPIDIQREGAGYIDVGGKEDPSPITGFYKIGEQRLLILKSQAIYEVKLPDEIDPQRKNPNLRPTYQKVSPFGTDDDLVCQVLLTAHELFRHQYLRKGFNYERAQELAFEGLKDINAMRGIHRALQTDQKKAWDLYEEDENRDSGVKLPSIPDILERLEMFTQKSKHAVLCVEQFVRLFYADKFKNRWAESLTKYAVEHFGEDDPFASFLMQVEKILLLIIKLRNAVEHPKDDDRIIAYDFSMNEDGAVLHPSFTFINATAPPGNRSGVAEFMEFVIAELANILELMMVGLCHHNVQKLGTFDIRVWEIPENRRRNKVRYGYWINLHGQWAPVG